MRVDARDVLGDASEFHLALVDAAMEECELAMEQCDNGDEGEAGMDEVYPDE